MESKISKICIKDSIKDTYVLGILKLLKMKQKIVKIKKVLIMVMKMIKM